MTGLQKRQLHLPFENRIDYPALLQRIIDAAAAWLIACALLCVLFDLLGYSFSGAQLLLPALAALAAVMIFARCWWLLPSALALFAAAVVFHAFYQDRLEQLWTYWQNFFRWAFQGMPPRAPFSENGSTFFVQTVFALPIAALSWLFVRRFFSILALGIAACALTVLAYYQHLPCLDFMLCAFLSACVISLPRVTLRRMQASGAAGVSRAAMQLLAVPAAALCLVFSLWTVPQGEVVWQNGLLSTMVNDVRDWYQYHYGAQAQPQLAYSVGQSGFMPLSVRLGGDIDPAKNRLFIVQTDRAYFLRAAVYDTYDGKMWYDSGNNGRFRYASLLWRIRRAQVFGDALPLGGADAQQLYDGMTTQLRYEISSMPKSIPNYLVIGALETLNVDPKREPAYFNMQGELFAQTYGQPYGTYTVESTLLDRSKPGFDEKMLELERLAGPYDDQQYAPIAAQYTVLPESLPESVFRCARQIVGQAQSPYQQASAIEAWLAQNCTYTLTPGTPPEEEDFVAYFLKTRQGYCTYYASAMTVLARCAGLPARYVTGFGMRQDGNAFRSQTYAVYNSTAHAWCEIYFSGIGWVAFDPLDWDDSPLEVPPKDPARTDASGDTGSEAWQEEQEELSWTGEQALREELAAISQSGQDARINWTFLWYVLGAAAAVLVLWRLYLFAMDWYFRRYRFSYALRRYPDLRACADYYYADMLRQLSFWTVCPRTGETLSAFAARVDQLRLCQDFSMQRVAALMQQVRYGEYTPSQEEIRTLYYAHDALENALLQALGKGGYFLERIVLRAPK